MVTVRTPALLIATASLSTCVALALFPPTSQARTRKAASDKQLVACVKKPKGKKKNGIMLFRKPTTTGCKKGWKKIWWNERGPQGQVGPQGPPGPAMQVRDANGAEVGKFLGSSSFDVAFGTSIALRTRHSGRRARVAGGGGLSPFRLYTVLRDGGIYTYLSLGRLWPNMYWNVNWSESDCSGAPLLFITTSAVTEAVISEVALALSGQTRLVYRNLGFADGWATSQAYVATGRALRIEGSSLYTRDPSGNCVVDGSRGGGPWWVAPLQSVTAPPDFQPPLTIG